MSTIRTEQYDAADPFEANGKITITMPNGATAEITVHPSRLYSNTVNVEIDGDFTRDLSMRIHMNDRLIVDTTVNDNLGPLELDDNREPDLDEGVPLDADDEDEEPK